MSAINQSHCQYLLFSLEDLLAFSQVKFMSIGGYQISLGLKRSKEEPKLVEKTRSNFREEGKINIAKN